MESSLSNNDEHNSTSTSTSETNTHTSPMCVSVPLPQSPLTSLIPQAQTEPNHNELLQLQSSLYFPNKSWSDQSPDDLNKLLLCKISQHLTSSTSSSTSLRVTHCLTVSSDLTWVLYSEQHLVDITKSSALSEIPVTLNAKSLQQLINILDCSNVCVGQPNVHLVKMVKAKKGKVLSKDGKVAAFVDDSAVATVKGTTYYGTVRTRECEIVSRNFCCDSCKSYRPNLRTMYNRWNKRCADESSHVSDSSSHTNDKYLSTPEKKAKSNDLKRRVHAAQETIKRLKDKIRKLSEDNGTFVDKDLNEDLLNVMISSNDSVKKAYPEGSFSRLFWEEQLKAASVKDARLIRWHPVMVKWCLNLKLLSSSAYHAMRRSGFIKLPTERTLRDYVHYTSNKCGFQDTVHQQLLQEVDQANIPSSRRYVSLILDEMKIKEGLVYNKFTGEIVGFTHLGDVNDDLRRLEEGTDQPPSVATHTLALMVRGLLFKLEFPYAHFATNGITADTLCPIIWEGIRNLECSGLKVLCVVADGASPNRKFFRMHGLEYKYKTINPYSPCRHWLYFVVDPPHLIKTVRNCWSHSGQTGTRWMTVSQFY